MADEPPDELPNEPLEAPGLPPFHGGDRVAGYEIESRIAAGQSDVYRAWPLDGGQVVALKIVPLRAMHRVPRPDLTNGIPHVVATHAIGTDAEWRVGYIAMQFVAGPSLADWIDRMHASGRRPTTDERRALVRLVQQIAEGLACLHQRGVVHGDVKPHNIVIATDDRAQDLDGTAVLVDLGTVREHGAPAAHSTLMLAPAYAAPEQILGHRLDGRTDLFSLGVMLHDAVLGRPAAHRPVRPTQGLEPLDAVDPSIDADLAAIVAECTALAPELRYPSARALIADLRRWSAGRRAAVRPLSPWRQLARMIPRRPRRAAAWMAAIATTSVAAVLIAAAVVRARERHQRSIERDLALARGDLAAAAAAAGWHDEAWLRHCETREAGLATVVALLRDDEDAALRQAARLVSRDGLAQHPALDRWFARRLADTDPSVPLHACRLLAQALYDHPRQPGDPVPAVRDDLLRLAARDTGAAALCAVSASGGLADLSVGDALLAAARGSAARHEDPREYLRLLVEAQHRVAFAELHRVVSVDRLQQAERQLGETAALLATESAVGEWLDIVRTSLEDWFVTLRACRDRLGLPAPDPGPLLALLGESDRCRAIARSPDLLRELLQGSWPAAIAGSAFHIGITAGYCCARDGELQAVRVALVRDPRHGSRLSGTEFDDGVAFAAARLRGEPPPWLVDPGSRLADELSANDEVLTLASEPIAVVPPTIALFDLRSQPARCGGGAVSIRGVGVQQLRDESRPPEWFLWLGSPGRSALELEFTEPRVPYRHLNVVVMEQRGQRAALPNLGEAGLDLLLDGEVQASWRDFGGLGGRIATLASPSAEPGRRRRLTLRLRADATTTLRVFQVAIE